MELTTSTPHTGAPIARAQPQVVRCACAVCGAHSNAVKTFRVTGSCPNCGSFDLSPIDGAEPLGGPVVRPERPTTGVRPSGPMHEQGDSVELTTSTPHTGAPIARAQPQVVRCACAVCGAHSNAVKTFRVTGSCPNCGSFDLSPIDGAEPLGGPVAA